MKFGAFIVAFAVGGVLAQVGHRGMAAATSSELTDAFSRLDAHVQELAERQRVLGGASDAASGPALPPGAGPSNFRSVSQADSVWMQIRLKGGRKWRR